MGRGLWLSCAISLSNFFLERGAASFGVVRWLIPNIHCLSGWVAMRQRILGSHTPPCHKRMVITTLSSMFCLAALQRRPVQRQLLTRMHHSRWLSNVLWLTGCLGQLAPTTLLQCRLVSNLSLCGPLSLSNLSLCGPLSLCVSSSSPSQGGVCLSLHPREGVSLPLHPPHRFLSVPLFPVSLPRLTPPPSACPCNSGVPPFARRRAQQRVEEPHSVPCDRVCLPEECFLEQPYQISSTRQPHVQAISIPTH